MANEDKTTKKEVKKTTAKKPAVKKAVAPKKTVKKTVVKKTTTPKKVEVVKKTTKKETFSGKYLTSIGRRKTAIARIRLYQKGNNQIIVNGKDYRDYFQVESMQCKVTEAFDKMKIDDKFNVSVVVKGGGADSQAEAVQHGISRALVKLDETYKKRLRKEGLLTRDSRMKERKKPGLKRARKAPRWSKR